MHVMGLACGRERKVCLSIALTASFVKDAAGEAFGGAKRRSRRRLPPSAKAGRGGVRCGGVCPSARLLCRQLSPPAPSAIMPGEHCCPVRSGDMPMTATRHALALNHGLLDLPAFLPDATLGVVRNVDSADLEGCGVQGLVMNTFHLMQRPGSSTVQALGGLHAMAGWNHPIVTDSGGFQAYSLIRENARYGSVTRRGVVFQPEGRERKLQLTPEKSIQLQLSYGADIVICLDYCTHVDDTPQRQEEAVAITIDWAALQGRVPAYHRGAQERRIAAVALRRDSGRRAAQPAQALRRRSARDWLRRLWLWRLAARQQGRPAHRRASIYA